MDDGRAKGLYEKEEFLILCWAGVSCGRYPRDTGLSHQPGPPLAYASNLLSFVAYLFSEQLYFE